MSSLSICRSKRIQMDSLREPYNLRRRKAPYDLRPLVHRNLERVVGRSETSHRSLVGRISLKKVPKLNPSQNVTLPYGFDQLTRYLPGKEAFLERASKGNRVSALCDFLAKGDWEGIIESYKEKEGVQPDDLAIDALGAFHDKRISLEQFCTLIFRWSLGKDFPGEEIQTIRLFDKAGNINPSAEEFIVQTLKASGSEKGKYVFLNKDEIARFFEKMKLLPESEKVFFCLKTKPVPLFDLLAAACAISDNTRTITEEVRDSIGVNVFNTFTVNEETYRMVPSLGMMQQFLLVHSGDLQAVKIAPTIGLSSRQDIENNGMNGTREMALPFPGITLPKESDLVLAPYDVDFWAHDFYHAIIASQIPSKARKAFIDVSKAIQEVNAEEVDPTIKNFLDEYYERVVDMEHGLYRKQAVGDSQFDTTTPGLTFLSSLTSAMSLSFLRMAVKLNRAEVAATLFDLEIKYVPLLKEAEIMEKIVSKLPKKFSIKAQITSIDLEKFYIKMDEMKQTAQQTLQKIPQMSLEELRASGLPENLNEEIDFQGEKMPPLKALGIANDEFFEIQFGTKLLNRKKHKKT